MGNVGISVYKTRFIALLRDLRLNWDPVDEAGLVARNKILDEKESNNIQGYVRKQFMGEQEFEVWKKNEKDFKRRRKRKSFI